MLQLLSTADTVPHLILEGDQSRRGKDQRRFRSPRTVKDEASKVDFSVRVVGIAFTVPSKERRPYARNLEERFDHSRHAQIMHQKITFGVNIWSNVMCDLPCVVTEANSPIECNRAEPDRATIRAFFKDLPQPNMMPPVGALAVRLFESQLLLLTLVVERTDRRVVVRPIEHYATDDFDTRPQRDRISGIPFGRMHGTSDVFLVAYQSNVQARRLECRLRCVSP